MTNRTNRTGRTSVRRYIEAAVGTLAACAALTLVGIVLGAPAHAAPLPRGGWTHADAVACHDWQRWDLHTQNGYRVNWWQITRMATAGAAPGVATAIREDMFFLVWDAPLTGPYVATSPGMQTRAARIIAGDSAQVAYDCGQS